jgi:hypothetical protein
MNAVHIVSQESTHLYLGLPSGIFPFGFSTNNLHAFIFSSISDTCPAYLILLHLIILVIFGQEYSYEVPCYAAFSNTLSLCSSLNKRDQISQPYRTTGKIIALHILISMFIDSRPKDTRFWTEWQ